MRNLISFFLILILFFAGKGLAEEFNLDTIKKAIREKGAKWQAEENWVTRLSFEEQKQLFGFSMEIPDDAQFITLQPLGNLPDRFDWRDNNGNWVTPVKNQYSPKICSSCWDFVVVAQIESWWKIFNSNPDSMIDLSEQFILSCGEAGSCYGGVSWNALDFARTAGVPLESCFPYEGDDTIPCKAACANWEEQIVKIPGFAFISILQLRGGEDNIKNIKTAILQHPVTAGYIYYADFSSYSGGVYEHVYGDTLGWHGVLIVGWNDDDKSWICKNSFGDQWGENGYFRIKWGECNIGTQILHIWDSMNEERTLIANQHQIDLSLTAGESIQESIQLNNPGQLPLEYYAEDIEFCNKNCFQPDSFNAFNGLSWWCHDRDIGGYTNWWLQNLDLPLLDLSNTIQPKLSFMGFWALELPQGFADRLADFDGWDGCNVWLSSDGGESFDVIEPTFPTYNCSNMYSYALMSSECYSGKRIGGWGGKSRKWVPVEFDLSNYKSETAIVRFTFSADGGTCTLNDKDLLGFFIDDIQIKDSEQILFQNSGEVDERICGHGMAGISNAEQKWLVVEKSAGIIPSASSIEFPFSIHTSFLTPGFYSSLIYFMANTDDVMSHPFINKLTINLNVQAAEHDIAIQSHLPTEYPLFIPIPISCDVLNIGKQNEKNFQASAHIQNDKEIVYEESATVSQLSSGESKEIVLKPFCPTTIQEYELIIQTENLGSDNNPNNNIIRSTISSTNTIDDFEKESNLWDCQGGWSITPEFVGYNDTHCMHVNGGARYVDNMDATMTLKGGFDLQYTSEAVLKYWIHSITYPEDICYIELSPDNKNWAKIDSISGSVKWEQREVDLTPMISQGIDKLGFRYHFMSDASKTRAGIYIDNIEIFVDFASDLDENYIATIPKDFALLPNYPNPFNPTTMIDYSIPCHGRVLLSVYNLSGQHVRTLCDQEQGAGDHSLVWDAADDNGFTVSSGIYLYQISFFDLTSGGEAWRAERKMLLLK
ncbi:hypothetical protein JW998_08105 [candidate division KSB1 bacterium]|nr:hypothetical protein [candidate division KSB1 bacterium]